MNLTKNFKRQEFDCKDGTPVPQNLIPYVTEVAQNLEILREYLKNKAIKINSAYRTKEHNKKIGGASDSQHLIGKAVDIVVEGYTPLQVYFAIEELIAKKKMKQGGLGLYDTFVHYDIRGLKARWNLTKKAQAKKKVSPYLRGL